MDKNSITQKLFWACIAFVILGLVLLKLGSAWGFLSLLQGVSMYAFGRFKIPSEPYSIGLYTRNGKRTNITAVGWVMRYHWFPLYIDVEVFEKRMENFEFTIDYIPCKGGGAVKGDYSIKYVLTDTRVKVFADNKGKKGVEDLLEDSTRTISRDIAMGKRGPGYTWEEMRKEGAIVAKEIWRAHTGSEMPPPRQNFLPQPGVNDVPNLGINLISITATFLGVDVLENALEEANAEQKRQQQEKTRLDNQMARAKQIYNDLPEAEKAKSNFGVILKMVMNIDAVRAGQGEVVQITGGGSTKDAAFADYVTKNQKNRKGK